MKKIIIIFLISISLTIFIYYKTRNNNLNVMVIGDSISTGDTYYGNIAVTYNYYLKDKLKNQTKKYDMTYASENQNIQQVQNYIINNHVIDNQAIKRRIYNSEIIIFHIGQDELLNLKNKYRIDFYNNFENVIKEIRKINNKSLFVIGYYNPKNQNFDNVNKTIKKITNKYYGEFINISDFITTNECLDVDCKYLNYLGHKKIYQHLYSAIKKDVISN